MSDPIRIGDRYVVFKILDEMTAQLHPRQRMKNRGRISNERKHGIAKAELVAELRDKYRLEPVRDGIAAAVEALRPGADVGPDPSAIALYQYDGGQITAADLIGAAKGRKGNVLGDTPRRRAGGLLRRAVTSSRT